MSSPLRIFLALVILIAVAGLVAWPSRWSVQLTMFNRDLAVELGSKSWRVPFINKAWPQWPLKQGLDILGGMQVVLSADMSAIPEADRVTALNAVQEVMRRRIDLYGVSEPVVQTARQGNDYRLIVELAGVTDSQAALDLVGSTAQLDFRLVEINSDPSATGSATFTGFESTGLTGKQLQRATVQFDPKTGQPGVAIEFNSEGAKLFADITSAHVNEPLAIFLDDAIVTMPVIQQPILNGQASITGSFSVDEAKSLSIQLNAGTLPVPVTVVEQRSLGASLGQASVAASVRAGLVGIGLVMLFMVLYYGYQGLLASLALGVYALLTVATYKLLGVTLTLPGIAGLLLSVGMAVDANILIFERMKEELRDGKPFATALELGFGRAWDSIKDANLATIFTALVLINPANLPFLNTSGLVRGFGITLLIGVLISLFTGVVVTRTLMRLFLTAHHQDQHDRS